MKRLHTKFLVFILLPVVGILIASAVLSFLIARHVVVKQLWFIGSLSIRQAVDEIDLGITTGAQTLKVMALQEEWVNLDQPGLLPFLKRLPRDFPIEEAFFAYPDGRYIVGVAVDELPAGYDHRLTKWYQKALESDGPIVSAPYVSPFSSNMIMTMACKVVAKDGRLKGVLGYNVPLTTIRQKMPSIIALEDFPGAVFSVFMRDGCYLMHSDDAKIGHKLGESGENLRVQMRQAMMAGEESWQAVGTVAGDYWFGGFQKSRQGDIFVALEIPLVSAVLPTLGNLALAYVALGLTSVVLLTVILIKMAFMIARPLRMLSAASVRLREGDYTETLPVISKDELGQLIRAFNTMTEGLRQRDFIRDTFGRYVTEEVVDQLLDSEHGLKLGGENREMTMIMSDLRGFTALTADMPPEKVITFLNRYLEAMVEILLHHRAVIDEIEGDGILAFFGAPTPMNDHAMRAVACALEMQREMENVNARNKADGLPRLEMAIAVNTGRVVVGNIGSEKRTKYGVVGSEVNFMGRIESFAVGGEVLVSQATYEKVRDAVFVDDVVQVEMKGIPEPVKLYSVRGIAGPFNVELKEVLYEPERIEQKIPLRLSRVDDNIVTPVPGIAWLTHLGETAAVLFTTEKIVQREEIRIDVLDRTFVKTLGEGFAKVVSVRDRDSGVEAVVRFTFISPGLRRLFRRAFVAGPAEKA